MRQPWDVLEQELASSNNVSILAIENNRSQLLSRTMDSYPIRYETNSTYSSVWKSRVLSFTLVSVSTTQSTLKSPSCVVYTLACGNIETY